MSASAVRAVLFGVPDIDPTAKLVLIVIAEHANEKRGDGMAWPSIETIARLACVSERPVQRHLRQLVADGWLFVEQHSVGGRGRTTVYRLNLARMRSEKPDEPDHNPGAGATVSPPASAPPQPDVHAEYKAMKRWQHNNMMALTGQAKASRYSHKERLARVAAEIFAPFATKEVRGERLPIDINPVTGATVSPQETPASTTETLAPAPQNPGVDAAKTLAPAPPEQEVEPELLQPEANPRAQAQNPNAEQTAGEPPPILKEAERRTGKKLGMRAYEPKPALTTEEFERRKQKALADVAAMQAAQVAAGGAR